MAKYEDGTYHKGSFFGGSNSYLNLMTCEDKNCYSIKTTKLHTALVLHISPSYRNGSNVSNDSPTFVLDRHKTCRPEGSN